jgi:signal transduction histidine kinase
MKGEFTPTDQDIMVSFARHAAVYIEKSRHLQQTDLVPELVHELRTPLAALNTAIHLLQRPDLPDEKRDQISEIIQMEFNRLTDLTTAFLDYSRLESGKEKFKRTRFDLNELIHDCIKVVQMQFYGRDLLFSFDLKTEPLNVTADRDKIKQVVLNLLNNAIKYSPPGGVIIISVGISSSNVMFSVQDHGPGIPPEFLPRLFERFYRVPKTALQIKGTGLGLTICKQIVETHDGRIEVASTVGEGSTFTVYLPAENSQ